MPRPVLLDNVAVPMQKKIFAVIEGISLSLSWLLLFLLHVVSPASINGDLHTQCGRQEPTSWRCAAEIVHLVEGFLAFSSAT